MRKHTMPEVHDDHPNVVPLIDIIMCLIVFFMLIARFGVDDGSDESIRVPPSIQGLRAMDFEKRGIEELPEQALLLNLRPAPVGDFPLVSALVQRSPNEPPRAETLVRSAADGPFPLFDSLRFLRYGADMRPGGTGPAADNDRAMIIIRADADLPYNQLATVLGEIARADITAISYQAAIVTEPRRSIND